MVTFTGVSGDSCVGSEPGIVDGVSVPKKNRHEQRRDTLGVSQALLRGQERPSIMHETQDCSPYLWGKKILPTCLCPTAFH